MVIYEVNLAIQLGIEQEFRTWLKIHIGQMLKIDGFISANVFEDCEFTESQDEFSMIVQYKIVNRVLLEKYLRDKAPEMRRDGLEKFPKQFRAWRRILKPSP